MTPFAERGLDEELSWMLKVMARAIALDVGDKTIGVAWSDEEARLAFPGETIIREEGYRRDMRRIVNLIDKLNPEVIVVGLPLMLDGTTGRQVEKVRDFISQLRRYTCLPIYEQDERLTTGEAHRSLEITGKRNSERKTVIDSVAACLILQSFLERKIETPKMDNET